MQRRLFEKTALLEDAADSNYIVALTMYIEAESERDADDLVTALEADATTDPWTDKAELKEAY